MVSSPWEKGETVREVAVLWGTMSSVLTVDLLFFIWGGGRFNKVEVKRQEVGVLEGGSVVVSKILTEKKPQIEKYKGGEKTKEYTVQTDGKR